MTTQTFGANVTERFKGATAVELRDIAEAVSPLTDMGRDVLWRAFLDSYEYSTVPKRAVFTKLIDKHDCQRQQRQDVGGGHDYCCLVCGARYEIAEGRCCPNCRNNDHNWTFVMEKGAYRNRKLRHEEEAARQAALEDRKGRIA
jgi:hypothetical protein